MHYESQHGLRYDTLCSDDPNTVIIRTDGVNKISDLVLKDGVGSVVVEAGEFTVVAKAGINL